MTVDPNKITTFLFDFDGVIRIWLEENTKLIEKKYGLDLGTIEKAAFTNELLTAVTTGKLKKDEWIRTTGMKINNLEAAIEWSNRPTYIDNEVIDLIRKLRSKQFPIFLLTNGTDNFLNELCELGLDEEFTGVFNSAEIGFAKPSPIVFQIVMNHCQLRPENIAFIDDIEENIITAQSLGIKSFHYKGINTLRHWLTYEFQLPD